MSVLSFKEAAGPHLSNTCNLPVPVAKKTMNRFMVFFIACNDVYWIGYISGSGHSLSCFIIYVNLLLNIDPLY